MTNEKTILVTGNTYEVRGKLLGLGGVWDAAAKGWRFPAAAESEVRKYARRCAWALTVSVTS